jgi:hypothetical protein
MGNWDRYKRLKDDWQQIQRCDWLCAFEFLFYDSLVYKTGIIYIYDEQRRCSCIPISYDSLCVQNRECFTALTSEARADKEISKKKFNKNSLCYHSAPVDAKLW